MSHYLKLLALIISKGTLQYNPNDFNAVRNENLKSLTPFIPVKLTNPLTEKLSVKKNHSTLSKLRAQLAFIKSSFRNTGGHLASGKLAYIRIPKSGNTSLSYAILTHRYAELKTKSLTDTQINFLADANLQPAASGHGEQFFTVVRNPFKRLVSVYRDFFELEHPQFIYEDYLFGILPEKISFAEFVNRVIKIPDRLKDQHLKPQHYFIEPYQKRQNSVTIFRLEEPEKLKDFLSSHALELTHRNKSGEAYDYTTYYTPEILHQACTIYQSDVKFFGYADAYEQLKSGL